jgi:hypothetical protein
LAAAKEEVGRRTNRKKEIEEQWSGFGGDRGRRRRRG